MSWLPRELAPPRQNQQRIIPPHVSFTVLLSPKPTSRHSQYPACWGGVVRLIWGLEKCRLPPSVDSMLSRLHSLPEREIVSHAVHGYGQVVMHALLQRRSCGRETELLPHGALIWGETSALLSCPRCNAINPLPFLAVLSFSPLPPFLAPLHSTFCCLCALVRFCLAFPQRLMEWFWRRTQVGGGGAAQTIPGAVLIEPSLCLVTAVYRGKEAQEWIQAALKSPAGSITEKLNKTETCRVARSGPLLSLASHTSTGDWSMWEYGLR